MKTFALIITLFLIISNAQTVNHENLSGFLGNRVNEFEDFFKIKSTKTNDNFGNLTIDYENASIDGKTYNIQLTTEGKNINNIKVTNNVERTKYFADAAKDLEKTTEVKKNYKTLYVSIVKKATGKKIFFDNTTELMNVLRNKTYDLKDYYGLVESFPLKSTLTIDAEQTQLIIK
ncbi:hypothetical protein [Chryseobacterium oryctis]|uniref:Uncharacterized protein n=1 Tax=Chryseobacterium oryctis TaxID=2952618 RepID=A0ABT3HKA7_9FLAO|nr:hypothetical protein [Chryseobacterium oryctis]MCW3160214.1 hypothetical protein [Chryseobacterium oryctis]